MASVDDFVIDFSKAEEGSGSRRIKPGTYRVKIKAAKATQSKDKGTPGIQITFVFVGGKLKGKTFIDTVYLSTKTFNRVKSLLEACGKRVTTKTKVTAGKVAAAIKGAELYIEVEDEEREGYSTRSRIPWEGFISLDDYESDEDDDLEDDEEEDDEEEPEPPKRGKKGKAKSKAKDDEDEDLDDLDLDDF